MQRRPRSAVWGPIAPGLNPKLTTVGEVIFRDTDGAGLLQVAGGHHDRAEVAAAMNDGRDDVRAEVVRRVLDRYLIEVVEAFGLCPWAEATRVKGELCVQIVWGEQPSLAQVIEHVRAALGAPRCAVAMVVMPELTGGGPALDALRAGVAQAVREAGVAAFGPHGSLELGTPAKLVPYLRRSPDPMLQLVPFSILDAARRQPLQVADRAFTARVLAGLAPPPAPSVSDRIAARNHATVTARLGELARVLADIAQDRLAAYPRAGILIDLGLETQSA